MADHITLVSGPGCPVCVTDDQEIDRMLAYCAVPGAIIATDGDFLNVPGSVTSLARCRTEGADVRVVYSALDALEIARAEPSRPVIFLGIGFEPAAPATALALAAAAEHGVINFLVHSAHKRTPPALRALLAQGGPPLDGLLCPGDVGAVLGEAGFAFLAGEHHMPAAIAGFEPLDIVYALDYLVDAALGRQPVQLFNALTRWVQPEGNPVAQRLLESTFRSAPGHWRGLGLIPASALTLRDELEAYDAAIAFPSEPPPARVRPGCRCGQVLCGEVLPSAGGVGVVLQVAGVRIEDHNLVAVRQRNHQVGAAVDRGGDAHGGRQKYVKPGILGTATGGAAD